jgi:hypothetical protein
MSLEDLSSSLFSEALAKVNFCALASAKQEAKLGMIETPKTQYSRDYIEVIEGKEETKLSIAILFEVFISHNYQKSKNSIYYCKKEN